MSARASMELLNRKHKAWFILLLFLSASPLIRLKLLLVMVLWMAQA